MLYRTNAQSRVLEESLRKRNIPYRIYGGLSFYQRKEIKDAISYFRMTVNPDDDEALRRIINYPARGIGETTMKKLQAAANNSGRSLWQLICAPAENPANLNAGTLRKLDSFRGMVQEYLDDVARGASAYEVAQLVYNRSGILTSLAHDTTPESISKQENLQELLSGLKDFVVTREESGEKDTGMSAFLSEVQLSSDQDEQQDGEEQKVTLMTVHAAKGLEFKHIYVVGVEEELFPSAMSMDSMAQIEEERRLLYVAITRAKETCVMTYATSRFRNGQTVMTRPSRFLADIDQRYMRVQVSSDISVAAGSGAFANPTASYRQSVFGGGSGFGRPVPGNSDGYGSSGGYSGGDFSQGDGYSRGRGKSRSTYSSGATGAGKKVRLATASEKAESRRQLSTESGTLCVGARIRHERFGIGTVKSIEHITDNDMIIVDFGVVGIKKLLLGFAKFTIL